MMLDRDYDIGTLDDLASLVARARPKGATPWQIAGVRSGLLDAAKRPERVTLAQLAYTAITVATDANARTPAVIAHDGPWWNAPAGPQRVPAGPPCSICNNPKDWHPDPLGLDLHDFVDPKDHHPARMPDSVREQLHPKRDDQ